MRMNVMEYIRRPRGQEYIYSEITSNVHDHATDDHSVMKSLIYQRCPLKAMNRYYIPPEPQYQPRCVLFIYG